MATAPTFGVLHECDTNTDFKIYVEILQQYFVANEIADDDKKRAIFLSTVGQTTYKLLRDLSMPTPPATRPMEELLKLLEQHFSPRPSEILQRFRFNSCVRGDNQSIADYTAQLRALAEHCN